MKKRILLLSLMILVLLIPLVWAITYRACGNSVIDGSEECDDGYASEQCTGNCTKTYCGDGDIQFPNGYGQDEDCDGNNLGYADTLMDNCNVNPSFYGHALKCDAGCAYNFTDCWKKGDGDCEHEKGENLVNSPDDCGEDREACGDSHCGYGENADNCPEDCDNGCTGINNPCAVCSIVDGEETVTGYLADGTVVGCSDDPSKDCVCLPKDTNIGLLKSLIRSLLT